MAFDVQSPPVCETSLEQLEDRFRSLINQVAKLQRTAGDASRRCGGEKTVKCGAESSGDLAHVNEVCLCLQHFAAAVWAQDKAAVAVDRNGGLLSTVRRGQHS